MRKHHDPLCPPNAVLDVIRERWIIDPDEGKVFTNFGRPGYAIREIGTLYPDGYWRVPITVGRRYSFLRSHIIWFGFWNEWPKVQVDHRSRVSTDDSIGNLRSGDCWLNTVNRSMSQDRELPVGVIQDGRCLNTKPYIAQAFRKYLGRFATVDEAEEAYLEATGKTKLEVQQALHGV